MKNHWIAAFLCVVFTFAATGCGTPRNTGNPKRRYGAPQTGTNLPRWTVDPSEKREQRSKQRKVKARREKRDAKPRAEKPKRERQERRSRPADEEVITRGGFR